MYDPIDIHGARYSITYIEENKHLKKYIESLELENQDLKEKLKMCKTHIKEISEKEKF